MPVDPELREQIESYLERRDEDFAARQEHRISEQIKKREDEREERTSRRTQRWTTIFGAGAFALISGFAIWLTNSVSETAEAIAATEARKVISDDELRTMLAENVNKLQQDALTKIATAIESTARAEELAKRYEAEANQFRERAADVFEELSSIESDLKKNRDIINQLGEVLDAEAGLEQIVNEALQSRDLQERILKASVFPQELVIASTVACANLTPGNWVRYLPATARMIVGAGRHETNLTEYPSFTDDPEGATGGAEEVTLTSEQMPKHNHHNGKFDQLLMLGTDLGDPMTDESSRTRPKLGEGRPILPAGGTERHAMGDATPHNNMPPYVALYFCKKD